MTSAPHPKISICIITYNQEKYVRQCLQSVIDQERDFNIEVIVSDDCSTDNTPNIIKEFAKLYDFITVILRKKNTGGTENFIQVHNMAKGEYVCHLDGDDYWYKKKLSIQAKILDNHPEFVQCWTCADVVNEDGEKIGLFPSRIARFLYPEILRSHEIALSYSLVGQHSTQMYRNRCRDENLIIETPLDYWIAYIISQKGKSFYSKEILSAYRVGSNKSITRTKSKKKVTVDILAENLYHIIDKNTNDSKYAKANLFIRKVISRWRGHDTSIINIIYQKTKNTPLNHVLATRSLWFFLLEKFKF